MKPYKLTDLDEAFARFHMLEFIVQNMLVLQLAELPAAESDLFKSDLVARMKNPRGPGVAQQAALAQRIGELAERFVSKVSEGEQRIRAGSIPRTERPQ